ncbi:MAG: sigma-70 family RNA polymerase sigma factor [Planctomycetes bacterium]|nr:sigma-70 family RNA polymerase sigma factor [Planctomycetota bacterium]
MARSESEILADVRRGDMAALGELLEIHQTRVFNCCFRMVGNRDDASELTQDAMLKAIEHIHGFNGQSRFSTWITRIAMNLSISHLRKRKLRKAASLDATYGGNGTPDDQGTSLRQKIPDTREPAADWSVQQKELMAHLHTALSRVEDDFRAVLVLRDIEEMDYDQIADVLAIPSGTVKSRLFRARLALRHEMLALSPPQRGKDATTNTDTQTSQR